MRNYNYSFKIFLSLLFFLCGNLFSQQVSDVSFELVGQNIHIYYTLTPISQEEYEITSILKRTTDATFSYIPDNISGDIGEGKFSGIKRKIVWNVSEDEMALFDGDDFYFEIIANKIQTSGGIPWYYYIGTAAVGGAAAALLLGGSDDKKPTSSTSTFADPPGRP